MAWKLINTKLSTLYQAWYSSEYNKALKSILSELYLQGIKGPVGWKESSPAHDLDRNTCTRCPAWRADASQAAYTTPLPVYIHYMHNCFSDTPGSVRFL